MTEDPTLTAFRDIVDRLRAGTGASRTTIRLDYAPLGLELDTVAVESLDHGVRALAGQRTPNVKEGVASRWLRENRRTFVMEDCLNPWAPEVAPEDYVIKLYGIRSEMVSGIFEGDELIGIVSVHYTKGPRSWSADEVEMIEKTCGDVRRIVADLENA